MRHLPRGACRSTSKGVEGLQVKARRLRRPLRPSRSTTFSAADDTGLSKCAGEWRRVAALHRELSRSCRGNTYFLSCRDGARAHPGLSYQAVSDINHTLERLGVIKVVRVGDQRPSGKASEFPLKSVGWHLIQSHFSRRMPPASPGVGMPSFSLAVPSSRLVKLAARI